METANKEAQGEKVFLTEGLASHLIALSYTEQQEEATPSDVLLLKRWHDFAEKRPQQFQ